MINSTSKSNFLSKLSNSRYGSLNIDADNDFKVIVHHLTRANIALSLLQGANFKKCVARGWGRDGGIIKPKVNSSMGISGQLKFRSQETYKLFVVGQFNTILSEVCSAADVLGDLLSQCYTALDVQYTVTSLPYYVVVLDKIRTCPLTSQLKTVILGKPAILDHQQFLPSTPQADVDLADCSFSFDLFKKLRNKLEHTSYEGLITFDQSEDSIWGSPEFYAYVSNSADTICGLASQVWARMAYKKGGSRDICVLGNWVLGEFISHLNEVIDASVNDL